MQNYCLSLPTSFSVPLLVIEKNVQRSNESLWDQDHMPVSVSKKITFGHWGSFEV